MHGAERAGDAEMVQRTGQGQVLQAAVGFHALEIDNAVAALLDFDGERISVGTTADEEDTVGECERA